MAVASHDGVGEGELKADTCFSERSAGRIEERGRERGREREDMKVSEVDELRVNDEVCLLTWSYCEIRIYLVPRL